MTDPDESNPVLDVSVVIPTHNRTDLLAETINSVLNQTLRPREIIVVDNGTEGNAGRALAVFGEKVRLIPSTPNAKQVARNNGILSATSAWIATLDDDDLWHPDYLATAAKAIRDGRADIIGVDHRKFCNGHAEAKTNFEMAPEGYWNGMIGPVDGEVWSFIGQFPRELLLKRVPFYPSSTLFRKRLALDLGGYDPAMKGIMSEDLEFLIRMTGSGEVAVIWQPLMQYRLHQGNDTASSTGREIGRWRIFEFTRSSNRNLDAAFRNALDHDLPARRRRIFDLAYGMGEYLALKDVSKKLTPADWTFQRRIAAAMSQLPRPLAEFVRKALMRATGRGHRLAESSAKTPQKYR